MAGGDKTDAQAGEEEDPIYEAAASWVTRLSSPDATEAERKAFDAWRVADPAHAEAYAEMDALWRKLGHVPDPRQRRRKPKGLAGIAVAAVLSSALVYQFGLLDRFRSDVWTGVGDIERSMLIDGSRIDLNTDTAVTLRFTDTQRGVELLRGEAAFDVVPDPGRPFVVRGNGLSVKAVGTRFFVRADGAERPVGVAEGRVEVAAAGRPVQVSAGEAVRLENGAPLSVVKADVNRTMAWRDGRLIFVGERLATVLAELGRYRHGQIILLDAKAGERRVTGAFDPRNTNDALNVISATMGVRVTRLTPLLVLVGAPL